MSNTTGSSLMQFQPIPVLPGYKPPPEHPNTQRRTPSPAGTAATISESFSTTASTGAMMNMMMIAAEDYSPVPGGLDASSQSSPGSASDHMGVIPTGNIPVVHQQDGTSMHVQPLFPGSSVLAAFDAGHPNLYGHQQQQQQQQQQRHQQLPLPPSIPTSTTSSGVTVKSPVLARRKGGSGAGAGITTVSDAKKQPNGDAGTQPGNTNRRQSRLQRNRESARLSRKRRKQYLELLEERVDKLSETLDGSRRHHVANAVATINQKRIEYILQQRHPGSLTSDGNYNTAIGMLERNLSRTNEELMIATTFSYQQLKSFSIPPSMQFTLWLTLQTDTYFRGGRTASERLSAARIGERMLSSGTESAAPSQSMWPLFCNEIGLSYDQEEKLRAIQRTLIQDHGTWVDRHTAYASRKVIESAHDATQALTLRAGLRERSTMTVLSNEQRMKMMKWSLNNRDRVAHSTVATVPTIAPQRDINPHYHLAANLYILNEQLQQILLTVPRAAPLLTGAALKRLSHRPSFEALGASDERSNEMCRDGSHPSSGSLKRNASEMSIEGDDSLNCAQKAQVPTISPVDAQATALPTIQQALIMVHDLLPPEPPMESMIATITEELQQELPQKFQDDTPIDELVYNLEIPMPAPVTSTLEVPPIVSALIYQAPAAYTQSAPSFGALQPPHAQQHVRKSSFLPAHLSVVPEELWPDETDEFLLDMIEGDWAIGEGIDMDLHQ